MLGRGTSEKRKTTPDDVTAINWQLWCIIAGELCRIQSMWPINWQLVATTYYDPAPRIGHQATPKKKERPCFPPDCHIAAFLSPSLSCTDFRHNAMAMAARRGFQLGCTDLRVEESAGPSSTTQKGIAFVIYSNLFYADLQETLYGVMGLFCAICPDGGPS
jgi:hypothetical protein